MTSNKIKYLFLLIISFYSGFVLSQESKISIAGAAFAPFDGGGSNNYNGCFVNRLDDGAGMDGNMYTGVDVPLGASITGFTAHFFDMALAKLNRPKLILRKSNGFSNTIELATAQRENVNDFPGYYEEFAGIEPNYVVQEDDFFDLIFVAGGDSAIINAYYICAVEVYYQLNE